MTDYQPPSLEQLHQDTLAIIDEVIADGHDPAQLYAVEHHFSCEDFARLEKAAIAAFKQGYEVTDAETFATDEGENLYSFDIIVEQPLAKTALLNEVAAMHAFAEKWQLCYDGWGLCLESDDDD